jgi:hypothetical protein
MSSVIDEGISKWPYPRLRNRGCSCPEQSSRRVGPAASHSGDRASRGGYGAPSGAPVAGAPSDG